MALWVAWSSVAGHPGLDEQIRDLTARIEAQPEKATLYVRRGELHRMHREAEKAEADYRTAKRLDPTLIIADFCLGRLALESGDAAVAKTRLDAYLTERPNDVEALVTRGRANEALGRHLAAAEDFTEAINNPKSELPRPEHYLERARALRAAGPEWLSQALAGLDEGLERLGQPVTLQMLAIELDLEHRDFDAALARLDVLSKQSVRQEPWLVRKAEVLESAGRKQEARQAYLQALASIDELPAARKTNRAVQRIESEARAALERLNVVPPPR